MQGDLKDKLSGKFPDKNYVLLAHAEDYPPNKGREPLKGIRACPNLLRLFDGLPVIVEGE